MPTYEYLCKKCGFVLEELQSITAPPLVHCPNCDTDSLVRTVGAGAGLIFRGSGFYQTDYKKSGGAGGAKPRKGSPAGEKGGGASPESGPASGDSGTAAGERKEKPEKKEGPGKSAGPSGPTKE